MNDLLSQNQSSYYLSEQVILSASKDPETRNSIIKFEYKLLSVYAHKYSLILLPKSDCITEWHGLITITYGLYAGAKFKFILNFPKAFPLQIPKIQLLFPLLHPLIDQQGCVDVQTLIPKWKYGQDCMLYNLLSNFHSMFIDVEYFDKLSSYNPEASELYLEDLETFADKIKNQIKAHNLELYVNRDNFQLKFNPPNEQTTLTMQKVQDINQSNISFQQKKKQLLDYLITKQQQQQ